MGLMLPLHARGLLVHARFAMQICKCVSKGVFETLVCSLNRNAEHSNKRTVSQGGQDRTKFKGQCEVVFDGKGLKGHLQRQL